MSPRTHPNDEPVLRRCDAPGPTVDGEATLCETPADHHGMHSATLHPKPGHVVRINGSGLRDIDSYRFCWADRGIADQRTAVDKAISESDAAHLADAAADAIAAVRTEPER